MKNSIEYLLRSDLSNSIVYKIAVFINIIIFFVPFFLIWIFRIIKDNILTLVGFLLTGIGFILALVKLHFIITLIMWIINFIDTIVNFILTLLLMLCTIPNQILNAKYDVI